MTQNGSGNNGPNTVNGANYKQEFNSLLDDLSGTKKQDNTPSPIVKESANNTMLMPPKGN